MTADECKLCGAPASRAFGDGALCDECYTTVTGENTAPDADSTDATPGSDPGNTVSTTAEHAGAGEDGDSGGEWADVDFTETASDTYPPTLLDREQWMGRLDGEKRPFAPWGDADHPDADPEKDARYKWGLAENYTTGEKVGMAEDDPRLGGRIFIQRDADPFAFVDGDDVRDPETGDVHPTFRGILARLGATYADVSTSGAGVHAYYRGDLPNDMGQAVFQIDTDPWGANDDPPTVEVYANKHVCVTTGEHVRDTPPDVRAWDADALADVLDEYDALEPETEHAGHDTDRDLGTDLDDHTPDATDRDDTATDARDITLAVDRLQPADLPLRTRQVDTDATGWEKWDPSTYRTSAGNDSLHRPPGEPVFHDFKHGKSFGVLSLFAAEQGILSKPWDRLAGDEWWTAVDTAREQGAPIPEYDGPTRGDADPVAVLPPAVRDLSTAASGWDWRHAAARDDDTLSVDDARERTTDAIADAYTAGDRVLVEALPTTGKSYGAVAAAAETGKQVSIFTGRGNKEQYEQFREWANEHDLDHYKLPAFMRDCPTANGEHGDEWAERVRDWYRRGATPQAIHKFAESVLGRPLPCQEHDNHSCRYASKWDFDPDEFDVLIGHYSHAYKQKVTSGRVCVFDEFPGVYETTFGPALQGAVSYWLQTTDAVPFEDYTDLLEHRDDDERRSDALAWFLDENLERDEIQVFDDASAHAAAPLAVFTILAGATNDLGNGFEHADLDDVGTGVRDRRTDAVSILQPPALDYAGGVVALDGTPTKQMWELSLDERLNHRQVLADDERAEYIRDALNLNLVRTTEYVKPYNSADHVAVDRDAALLEMITETHDAAPAVITTTTARDEFDDAGVLDIDPETGDVTDGPASAVKWYGDVLGSNEFDDERVGAVLGSNHYGDDYIKKWGGYAGRAVEREDPSNDGKGTALSYGTFGDKVLTHMREHDTLQAAMRFGRDGNGAVVYVHTDTLPEWVPVAGEGRVVTTWSDGMKSVVRALETLGAATTAEIADHPAVEIGERQVLDHLDTLRNRGVVDRQQDGADGRRVVWRDDGVHRVNDHGDVELDPVDVDDLDKHEVRELARSSIYTWQFANRDALLGNSDAPPGERSSTPGTQPSPAGGDPPDPGD